MQGKELNLDKKVIDEVLIIWDYMQMHHKLKPADIIFVLGSRDDRVAEYAAELYHKKYAPKIIVSGGVSHKNDLLATKWKEKSEAEHFSSIMVKNSVPKQDIILERKATNTGENIKNSYFLLKKAGLLPKSIILVQKPYMERRTFATFTKQWPSADRLVTIVTSPKIGFKEYVDSNQTSNEVISIMLGDLQRIIEYPALGYQIHQDVSKRVQEAYNFLIQHGYTKHLIQQK